MDFPLRWDRAAFFAKYKDHQIETGSPFYVDYAILLAGWEASAWDQQCRQEFERDPRSQHPTAPLNFSRSSLSQVSAIH